jgi:diacylglycerol kinase family enzyme
LARPEPAVSPRRPSSAAATLFINPSAGSGDKRARIRRIEELFSAEGVELEMVRIDSAGDLGARIAAARRAGRTIVAGGGDGTINAVASHVVGTGAALGILPLGTLNHFAKDVGIPLELEAAVRVVTAGHVELVDVGEVNGAIFLNNSSLGIYPRVVRLRERQEELGHARWSALAWAILRVLRRPRGLDVHLEVDRQDLHRRTPFVLVSNNLYETRGLGLGARRSLSEGVLGLYVLRKSGRKALLKVAVQALLGTLDRSELFEQHAAKQIRVESRHREAAVAIDGEVRAMVSPFDYRIRPGELSVLTPADRTEREV